MVHQQANAKIMVTRKVLTDCLTGNKYKKATTNKKRFLTSKKKYF
jgi:hypothetical protein